MNNYKLVIQYDGTRYCGWQIQENGNTIQQEIVNAVKVLLKETINLIGAGRTDSGVHALGQSANFKTEQEIDIYRFKHSLNSILPRDISIVSMTKEKEEFHARYDAKKRSYFYLISGIKSPFFYNYSAFLNTRFNIDLLNDLSSAILGEHDFSSFCKTRSETENKICNVYSAYWRRSKSLTIFLVEADRFLHGMVRTIVGTIILAEKNNYDKNYIIKVINDRNREAAGEAVPSKGLFLYKVKY